MCLYRDSHYAGTPLERQFFKIRAPGSQPAGTAGSHNQHAPGGEGGSPVACGACAAPATGLLFPAAYRQAPQAFSTRPQGPRSNRLWQVQRPRRNPAKPGGHTAGFIKVPLFKSIYSYMRMSLHVTSLRNALHTALFRLNRMWHCTGACRWIKPGGTCMLHKQPDGESLVQTE